MNGYRQVVAIAIAVGIVHLTIVDVARPAEPSGLRNPAAVKQQVDQLGVGAKVKIRLDNGKKLNGTIKAIEDDSFLLVSKESSPTPVAYEHVAQLKLAKITYKSKGTPDADEARRVVAGLGVGRHIVVKTTAGEEYHGTIQLLGAENFSMLPDHQTTPVQIAYDEILQTGPNLSKGAKIAIGVGVAVAVLIIVAVIAVKPWQSE